MGLVNGTLRVRTRRALAQPDESMKGGKLMSAVKNGLAALIIMALLAGCKASRLQVPSGGPAPAVIPAEIQEELTEIAEELRDPVYSLSKRGCENPAFWKQGTAKVVCLYGFRFRITPTWWICPDQTVKVTISAPFPIGPGCGELVSDTYESLLDKLAGEKKNCENPTRGTRSEPHYHCISGVMHTLAFQWWHCPDGSAFHTIQILDKGGQCPANVRADTWEDLDKLLTLQGVPQPP